MAKNCGCAVNQGLEVHDRRKYSGSETGEDTDHKHIREGSTSENNQGLGETSYTTVLLINRKQTTHIPLNYTQFKISNI